MADLIQIRNGTVAEWISTDPILAQGELGIENDTTNMKIGDGVRVWTALPYSSGVEAFQHNSLLGIQGGQAGEYHHLATNELSKLNQLSGRNLLINGDFSVWQRGISITIPAAAEYTADRMFVDAVNAANSSRVSMKLDKISVAGDPDYMQVTAWSADTAKFMCSQGIEAMKWTEGEELTYSLEIFIPTGATFDPAAVIQLKYRADNMTSRDGTIFSTYNFSDLARDSWVKLEGTFNAPTATGYMSITPAMSGMNNTQSGFNIFNIRNFQLERGSQATDFEVVQPADQLARCQRYYSKSYDAGTAPGAATHNGIMVMRNYEPISRGTINMPVVFPVKMRVIPAITLYSSDGTINNISDAGTAGQGGTNLPVTDITNAGERSACRVVVSPPLPTTSFGIAHFTADAEIY